MKVILNHKYIINVDDNRLLIQCKIYSNKLHLKLSKHQTSILYRRLSNKAYNYFSNKVLHVRLP